MQTHDMQIRALLCSPSRRFESARVLSQTQARVFSRHVPLKRGDTIGDYTIATMDQTETEFLESYPDYRATHTAKDRRLVLYGTRHRQKRTHNAIGMANRAAPKVGRNNARILASGRVVARRESRGHEIFIAYGSGYRI